MWILDCRKVAHKTQRDDSAKPGAMNRNLSLTILRHAESVVQVLRSMVFERLVLRAQTELGNVLGHF